MAEASESSSRNLPHYEPSDHREVRHATTYFETILHMIKASIGTGILAMPNAFSKAGYVIGIIGTIVIGMLCTYCMRILVKSQYELCRRQQKPAMTYPETAQNCVLHGPECCVNFKHMGLLGNIFVLGFQIGAACIYIIFVSKNVKQVVEYYGEFTMDLRLYFLLTMIPIVLTATINNLKFLSILSLTANVTLVAGFSIIGYYMFKDTHEIAEAIKERTKIGPVSNYPLFAGTVVFSMEAIGVVMPLENEMKDPYYFTSLFGVLNVAMIPTVILYIFVGLIGFVKYGDKAKGSLTLNLPQTEVPSQACKLLLSYEIFATYILALFVAYDIIWKSYIQPKYNFNEETWKTWGIQYSVRILLIILTFLLATLIPNLELFISLVGSLCLASAGVAFPGLFNLFLYWRDYTGVKAILIRTWYFTIIVIGAIICVMGVTLSFRDIYNTLYRK